jgi:GNAT superfamily N-acetyltransferase
MTLEIARVGADGLAEYARIPIWFRVESVLRVSGTDDALGGLLLREEAVDEPYVKDYDEFDDDPPAQWGQGHDLGNWGIFLAREEGVSVGAAAGIVKSSRAQMLMARDDVAVLWDIRVHPDHRRRGIGARLLQHVAQWAREWNCTQLRIETQNVNVGACRFYASQGCRLGAVCQEAYSEARLRHETMLLWYLDL